MHTSEILHHVTDKVGEFYARNYLFFVWWAAIRYLAVGIEYLIGIFPQQLQLVDLDPVITGSWLVLIGVVGMGARVMCWTNFLEASNRLMHLFGVLVVLHALFRLSLMAQHQHFNAFLTLLFVVDASSMLAMLFRLHPYKS